MTELRFARDLYDGKAVDEALKIFESYGTFERAEEPSHWVVRLTGKSAGREKRVSRELANYALGLTIKGRKAS
jgi:hypothetical protein